MSVRGLAGTSTIFFLYSAVKYIPLADATIFLLSVPVFVFIFARCILHEPFGRWHVVALVLSLLGIGLASKIDVVTFVGRWTHGDGN